MAAPKGTRAFPLRSGSTPFGVGLVVVGLLALLLIPPVFNDVSFARRGDELLVRVARRPRKALEVGIPVGEVEGVKVTSRVVAGRTVFELALGAKGRAPVALGLGTNMSAHAQARAEALEAQLKPLLA
jgi:hypothetical protein